MDIYTELGDRIERAFELSGRNICSFPKIAAEALHDARIPERSSAEEVLSWVLSERKLPPQNDLDEAFGEPPITVYRGRDFHVEVLFWLTTVTTVHNHGFSGAFQALSGERLQTRHAFDASPRGASLQEDGSAPLAVLGEARFVGGEVLTPSDVVEISHDLTHAIVHLAEPSATIVVRTASDPAAGSQLDFRAPWIAVDPFHTDEARLRKLGVLRLLCRAGRPDALALAADVVSRSDLATGLDVLDAMYRELGTESRIEEVIFASRARHGAQVTAQLLEVLREDRRLRAVAALRRHVSDPLERFFLSVLHHVPHRGDVFALLAERYPGHDPKQRAFEIASGMSGTTRIGIDFNDPLTRSITLALLAEETPEGVRRELAKEYEPSEVEASAEQIERHAARIRRTVMAPLFRTGARSALRDVEEASPEQRRAAPKRRRRRSAGAQR